MEKSLWRDRWLIFFCSKARYDSANSFNGHRANFFLQSELDEAVAQWKTRTHILRFNKIMHVN